MWTPHFCHINIFLGPILASFYRAPFCCIYFQCFIGWAMNCQTRRAQVILMLARWWQFSWQFKFSFMSRPICLWSLLFLTCVSFFRFYLRNILVVVPVTLLFVDNIGGFRPLQHSPWSGGVPQSYFSFFIATPLLTCACIFQIFYILVHM